MFPDECNRQSKSGCNSCFEKSALCKALGRLSIFTRGVLQQTLSCCESVFLQDQVQDAMLCLPQLATLAMTTPSPAARPTLSTVAWAAIVRDLTSPTRRLLTSELFIYKGTFPDKDNGTCLQKEMEIYALVGVSVFCPSFLNININGGGGHFEPAAAHFSSICGDTRKKSPLLNKAQACSMKQARMLC